jgi:hypothetical protein
VQKHRVLPMELHGRRYLLERRAEAEGALNRLLGFITSSGSLESVFHAQSAMHSFRIAVRVRGLQPPVEDY